VCVCVCASHQTAVPEELSAAEKAIMQYVSGTVNAGASTAKDDARAPVVDDKSADKPKGAAAVASDDQPSDDEAADADLEREVTEVVVDGEPAEQPTKGGASLIAANGAISAGRHSLLVCL